MKCDVCKGRWPCKADKSKKLTERKMLHIYALRLQGTPIYALSNIYNLPMFKIDEILEHVRDGFKV